MVRCLRLAKHESSPLGTMPTLAHRAQYANCYDNYRLSDGTRYDSSRSAWWGKYKNRTMPILGNHEYLNSSDSSLKSKPYFDYFSAKSSFPVVSALRHRCRTRPANPGLSLGKGYYSYDLGSWHIVALNSNDHCAYVSCSSTSAQGKWLRNDLAANSSACTLAYIHHPLYATGSGGVAPEVKPLIKILYNNHADVVLNAHNHRYERLARIDPNGNPDRARGIRTITVGTGGEPGNPPNVEPPAISEVRIFDTPGVIRMDLRSGSYSWKFVAVDGRQTGRLGTQPQRAMSRAIRGSLHGTPREGRQRNLVTQDRRSISPAPPFHPYSPDCVE